MITSTSKHKSNYVLPFTIEQLECEAEERALMSVARDVKDFCFDVFSCSAYIVAAYEVMLRVGVAKEISFSTALLLGGVPIFNSSTHWMRRTRKRVQRFLKRVLI